MNIKLIKTIREHSILKSDETYNTYVCLLEMSIRSYLRLIKTFVKDLDYLCETHIPTPYDNKEPMILVVDCDQIVTLEKLDDAIKSALYSDSRSVEVDFKLFSHIGKTVYMLGANKFECKYPIGFLDWSIQVQIMHGYNTFDLCKFENQRLLNDGSFYSNLLNLPRYENSDYICFVTAKTDNSEYGPLGILNDIVTYDITSDKYDEGKKILSYFLNKIRSTFSDYHFNTLFNNDQAFMAALSIHMTRNNVSEDDIQARICDLSIERPEFDLLIDLKMKIADDKLWQNYLYRLYEKLLDIKGPKSFHECARVAYMEI